MAACKGGSRKAGNDEEDLAELHFCEGFGFEICLFVCLFVDDVCDGMLVMERLNRVLGWGLGGALYIHFLYLRHVRTHMLIACSSKEATPISLREPATRSLHLLRVFMF